METILDVLGHFFDCLVSKPSDGSGLLAHFELFLRDPKVLMLIYQAPNSGQKTISPLYAFRSPLQVPLRRRGKQTEKPNSVRAITVYQVFGIHYIAFGLGHLSAVLDDHPLGEEVREGLVGPLDLHVSENFGEKRE